MAVVSVSHSVALTDCQTAAKTSVAFVSGAKNIDQQSTSRRLIYNSCIHIRAWKLGFIKIKLHKRTCATWNTWPTWRVGLILKQLCDSIMCLLCLYCFISQTVVLSSSAGSSPHSQSSPVQRRGAMMPTLSRRQLWQWSFIAQLKCQGVMAWCGSFWLTPVKHIKSSINRN